MNALLPLFAATSKTEKTPNILAAAKAMAPHLARARILDRKLIAGTMTACFGASDAQGAWTWRDAYDATEAAMVLQMRRIAPQLGRIEDATLQIVEMLDALGALCPTHTRRDQEQLDLDQFSTPAPLAALTIAAAQIRPGDQVLEPSAGTGLLAIVAEACGAAVQLNELSPNRAGILRGLFPAAHLSQLDAILLPDVNKTSGSFHAVVTNPPFQQLLPHLKAALQSLAIGGRMSAVVPIRAFHDTQLLAAMSALGQVQAMIQLPDRAFAKHGTDVGAGLLVVDRRDSATELACRTTVCEDLAAASAAVRAVAARDNIQPRSFREHVGALGSISARAAGGGRPSMAMQASRLDYDVVPWTGEGQQVGIFQAYGLSRIRFAKSRPHPSELVEAAAMASVPLPAPTYRPTLPSRVLDQDLLSDAQLETVVYAGEAHSNYLPGYWLIDPANPFNVQLVSETTEGAVQFRRAFFLGDGTGCGKGRQAAAIIADSFCSGRTKAVWISKNDSLLEDTRRDWTAIGGRASDVMPQGDWSQRQELRLSKGIIFSTYATLRQPSRGAAPSRLDQLITALGEEFDGVIILDEAHAAANAAGGVGKRGRIAASQQGLAVLALQNRLPNARVVYVSATGATTPENLAYANRLGLWGGPEAPFDNRDQFLAEVERGGVAVMEVIARELKAMGLYCARSLSFEGVEYEPLQHELTAENIEIWDKWADAFQAIHANLRKALEAIGVTSDGETKSGQAKSAALSAFEGSKLRFFGHLLAGMKTPTILARIHEVLANDQSAVLQIVSTNEAVMERRLQEIPPHEWNDLVVDLTPKEYVLDYLKNAFPLALMEEVEDEKGNAVLRPVVVDGAPVVSQQALALRDELLMDLACLPAVPGVLDGIIDAMGSDKVAEITGRSRRVVRRGDRRMVERRGPTASKSETDAFMRGQKRVLVFSEAGGTGRSYHADRAAQNTQRRVHLLIEPGYRASSAVQGLGRTHRTNQVSTPLFQPVTTNIQGEKRFLSTIARRLDSLGALTRGERRSASNGLFRSEDNLESEWACYALTVFYHNLYWGELDCMTFAQFEAKTGLELTDQDGLKDNDRLPAMNTWLNRVLALRIADQNAVFADFEKILTSILERAAAAGELDRGVEDIDAQDLRILGEEIIRTDPITGATTNLISFAVRTLRSITRSDDALANYEGHAFQHVVNRRNGKAALVLLGQTTMSSKDRLIEAVRVLRPTQEDTIPLSVHEESAWEIADPAIWQAAWDAEVASTDPYREEPMTLATGMLLPIWTKLSSARTMVRRMKAPDGRRWLGRLLDEADADRLRVELGLTSASQAFADPARARQAVLIDGVQLQLAGDRHLRRTKIMDRQRIELVGVQYSERSVLTAFGCFTEIIASTPRTFVPADKPEVLAKVLERYPVTAIAA